MSNNEAIVIDIPPNRHFPSTNDKIVQENFSVVSIGLVPCFELFFLFSVQRNIDKNGVEKISTDVRVNDVALQGGKREVTQQPQQRQQTPKPSSPGGFEDMNDDVPFADPMKRRVYALCV